MGGISLVQMTEFNREEQIVVFETDNGKIRLTFDEWKRIVEGFYNVFGIEDISFFKSKQKERNVE